jgi:Holliday junction resolvasome RuvABC endonuclease subunit
VGDRLLALDLGTRTGWALFTLEGDLLGWGDFYCAKTKSISQWVRFRRELTEVAPTAVADRLACVAMERPFSGRGGQAGNRDGGRQAGAGRVTWGLICLAEHWADTRGIEREAIPPARVKKLAAGNGRASKPQVCDAMAARFPGRGFEGLHASGKAGRYDGSDAAAVGVAWLALNKK